MTLRADTVFVSAAQRAAPGAVLVACAFSAGIHLALIPGHAEESAGLGAAFGLAGGLLLVLGIGVFMRPRSAAAALATALLLAALIGAYLISRGAGLPWTGHGPEPFDAVGLLTKAAELAALVASVHLYAVTKRSRPRPLPKTRSST